MINESSLQENIKAPVDMSVTETAEETQILEKVKINDTKIGREPEDLAKKDTAVKRRGRPKKVQPETLEINRMEKEEAIDFISEEKSSVESEKEEEISRKRGRKRKIINVKHSKDWKEKKCRISGEISSEGEEQVPLKITFKRPGSNDDGSGKSIKLRVKTQTTSDHSFNIQIKQPNPDNPVRFRVKPAGELRRKKSKSLDDIAERLAKKSRMPQKSFSKEDDSKTNDKEKISSIGLLIKNDGGEIKADIVANKDTKNENQLDNEKKENNCSSKETSPSCEINGTQILEEVVNKSESVPAVTSSPTAEVASNQVGRVVQNSTARVAPLYQVESSALAFSGKIILTKIEFHLPTQLSSLFHTTFFLVSQIYL